MKKRDYCNGASIDGNCGLTDCPIIQNGNCGPKPEGFEKFGDDFGPPEGFFEEAKKRFDKK